MERLRLALAGALIAVSCVGAPPPRLDPLAGAYVAAAGDSAAPGARALTDGLAARHPGMRWTVNDTGSTTALSQVVTGSADVAFFTRELTEAERRSVSVNGLGFVGQVIAVHPDNPVTSLTREQLRGIFGGTITDWAAVGGQAGPITVLVRQAGSATREALDPLLLGPGGTYGVSATTIGDAAGMVAAVARSRGSIGMVGQPHLPPGPGSPKALAIDGVAPSVPNIASARYPYRRPVYLLIRASLARPGALGLVEFLRTTEGTAILARYF